MSRLSLVCPPPPTSFALYTLLTLHFRAQDHRALHAHQEYDRGPRFSRRGAHPHHERTYPHNTPTNAFQSLTHSPQVSENVLKKVLEWCSQHKNETAVGAAIRNYPGAHNSSTLSRTTKKHDKAWCCRFLPVKTALSRTNKRQASPLLASQDLL